MNSLSNRPQNNPDYNLNYFKACRDSAIKKKEHNITIYDQNKKSCVECATLFEYKDKNKKFCNQSCAAKFNNRTRSSESRNNQKLKLRSKFNSDEKVIYGGKNKNACAVTFTNCKSCNSAIRKKSSSNNVCNNCKLTKIKPYRRACKFTFTEKTNPELYNYELINKYGWYKPTNSKTPNLNGVTWDHLFKIEDGFKLGVDPKIMSHPANAELITWRENYSRHRTGSSITYEDLLLRIDKYNRYGA